jgi:DNA-binding transcriptional MocR family regulator
MISATTKVKDLLYMRIAKSIQQQISDGVLKIGDKLPSIRMVCREHGVSMSTASQAYLELESKSMIESRPQSGYYVSYCPKKQPQVPETSQPDNKGAEHDPRVIVDKVFRNIGKKDITLFSLSVPANDLLPIAKLNKGIVQAMRTLPDSGTGYEEIQGNEKLRRQVAKWSFNWGGGLTENDLVTTAGCMNAISFAMMSLTKRGDTIAVESPAYFGIMRLAESLGLNVLELPTNARTGVEIDALKTALKRYKITLCLLVSNFNNPLGSCMPDEHKKEVVALLQHYNVPLIEDDLYGDVYFGDSRPKCCKTYDESGLVLWCGSVSKTLAPGYRVGWVSPGKYKEEIIRMKQVHSISSTTIMQEVIANFLENGRYENHLRKLRHTLHTNCLQYIRAIADYFPEGTKVSRPQGGFVLWVELDKRINTMELYEIAMRKKISIAPGRMFTLQKQFDNCMRISYGLPWNEELDATLKTLGNLVKGMLVR